MIIVLFLTQISHSQRGSRIHRGNTLFAFGYWSEHLSNNNDIELVLIPFDAHCKRLHKTNFAHKIYFLFLDKLSLS